MSDDDRATTIVMQHGHHYKDEKGNTWEEHPEYNNGPIKWMMRTGKGNLSKLNSFNSDGTSSNSMVPDLVLDLGIPATTVVIDEPGVSIHAEPADDTDPIIPGHTFPHKHYEVLLDQTIKNIRELGTLKGGEYAGDIDRLANFRRNAADLGTSIELIWAVYAFKHIDAIKQYIKDRSEGKTRQRLEPLSGRVDDVIVYMILFKAILMEIDDANTTKA